jgi:hypothetical protein
MRRVLLAALASLTMAAPAALAAWPTGLAGYRFQADVTVSPDPEFTGTQNGSAEWLDTTIRYSGWATLNNFGNEDTLGLAPIVADSSESLILMKCDFASSLPPNFVCVLAYLGIRNIGKNPESVVFTPDDQIVYLYRFMDTWTSEGTGQGFWRGATGAPNTIEKTTGVGYAADPVDAQGLWNPFKRSGSESTRDSSSIAANGWWGTDEVFNAAALTTKFNIPSDPEASFYLRQRRTPPAGTDPDQLGSQVANVTHFVNQVISGAAENNGWLLTNSTSAMVKTDFFASSEHANLTWRPWMEIYGYVIGAGVSAGGSGRRVLGGSSGPH